jgi:hypothetical protein
LKQAPDSTALLRLGEGAVTPSEVVEVLEGRDSIGLDEALVSEAAGESRSPEPPAAGNAVRRIRELSVAERVKLALRGNKAARSILARDPVRLVQGCVLQNPRITLEEALAMAKNRSLHGDLLRMIADERDWVRNYAVRLALVRNPKTPIQVALGLLGGVQERDIRLLARSREVPSVLQQQARRILARKGLA